MTPYSAAPRTGGFMSWFRRAERWLDDRGRPAWIAAMVLAFIFIWPVGLAVLAYLIWSKRMFSRHSCAQRNHRHHDRHMGRHSSGNTVFDAYKADTLRRLEEEQMAFESFLQRLRDAKDKSEFDTFMQDRAAANRAEDAAAAQVAAEAPPPRDTLRGGDY
ncbi:MAG: DUF2852 domain-containing protein [Pseudomonadota bacterium]